MLLTGRSYAA